MGEDGRFEIAERKTHDTTFGETEMVHERSAQNYHNNGPSRPKEATE